MAAWSAVSAVSGSRPTADSRRSTTRDRASATVTPTRTANYDVPMATRAASGWSTRSTSTTGTRPSGRLRAANATTPTATTASAFVSSLVAYGANAPGSPANAPRNVAGKTPNATDGMATTTSDSDSAGDAGATRRGSDARRTNA